MGEVLIQCVDKPWALPLGEPDPTGLYLAAYEPEMLHGRGYIRWTKEWTLGKRFADLHAALEEWRRIPKCRPTREDGEPNRPLSAYTCGFPNVPPLEDRHG